MPTPSELSFVKTFIDAARQERYLYFLTSTKGRAKLRASLGDLRDLNWSICGKIEPNLQNVESILNILRKNGARPLCHIISESKKLDDKEMSLNTALREVVGLGIGTVIICVPDKLAYYEGEGKGERYLCLK
jgi:hypothetical protein